LFKVIVENDSWMMIGVPTKVETPKRILKYVIRWAIDEGLSSLLYEAMA
jgi:hypothetical protein